MKAYAYRPGIGVKASKIVEVTEPETGAGKAHTLTGVFDSYIRILN